MDADGVATPKKRTRRGSRGGRRRRKPAVAGEVRPETRTRRGEIEPEPAGEATAERTGPVREASGAAAGAAGQDPRARRRSSRQRRAAGRDHPRGDCGCRRPTATTLTPGTTPSRTAPLRPRTGLLHRRRGRGAAAAAGAIARRSPPLPASTEPGSVAGTVSARATCSTKARSAIPTDGHGSWRTVPRRGRCSRVARGGRGGAGRGCAEPVEVGADAAPDGYVPMSEWLDDFDRR